MSKDPHIDETIEQLTLLSMRQDELIKTSNEIIELKNEMIKLCEKETALYKRESKRLQKIVFWLSICLGATSGLLLFML
tara:strand:+ start:599 stop:835 length:237 start_codon:yes stop_codon:yes gene_type:complete